MKTQALDLRLYSLLLLIALLMVIKGTVSRVDL
jgi:hypothetical protein